MGDVGSRVLAENTVGGEPGFPEPYPAEAATVWSVFRRCILVKS